MLSLDYWTIIFSFINIIVLFIVLKIFLFKPVMGIMEKRKQAIESTIANAEEQEQDAFALHEKYENEILESKSKADDIIAKAKGRAQNEYNKILSDARIDADKVIETARKDFEVQKEKELRSMRESIVDIAILAAMKASEESIDEEKSKKLLEELVMKAGA